MITGLCISKAQYLTFFCPKYIFCLHHLNNYLNNIQ